MDVMGKEFAALMKKETWELAPPPKHGKIISNKRVFVLKLKFDKTLERYKSRLVSRDFF